MQLQTDAAKTSSLSAFRAPARCPNCDDWMVAPLLSEFVAGGEIRHHWACESCGEPSTVSIPLAAY